MVEFEVRKNISNPFEKARRERMAWIIEYLGKEVLELNHEIVTMPFIAFLSNRFGVREDKAREYLRMAIFTLGLTNADGKIVKLK